MTAKNPYWIVGNQEGRAYVERDADIKLRRELTDNQRYLFLYGPRSSGKSSLIIHCMDSLSPGQYCCTRVDVSRLPLTDYPTFIGRLLETVAQDTALDKQVIRSSSSIIRHLWNSTVFTETHNIEATSFVPFPSAISWSTSRCLGVRVSSWRVEGGFS